MITMIVIILYFLISKSSVENLLISGGLSLYDLLRDVVVGGYRELELLLSDVLPAKFKKKFLIFFGGGAGEFLDFFLFFGKVVIPKEGWARPCTPIQKNDGRGHALQSFLFWYDNDSGH